MTQAYITEREANMDVFTALSQYNHEAVFFCNDNASGLRAIIAIHNTTLGPAMGGLRMWPYKNEQEALTDVLRLSRAMTYKNALAGLNVGGGKAVIIGDSRKDKSEALIRRFGKFLNNLGGKYYTAEDVGMSEMDMELISMETPYVTGLSTHLQGSGDPSPFTAYGTLLGIKAALKYSTGNDALEGKSVMVQGIGSVGGKLVKLLRKEGAIVYIYDIHEESLQKLAEETGAIIVPEGDVFTKEVDILAPCALGGILNPDTIPGLNCSIVSGAANNQLLDEKRDAQLLKDRGILFTPDFMVNAGGIINVSLELERYNSERAYELTGRIYDTTLRVLRMADEQTITTHEAALQLAESRIKSLGNNLLYV